jgi:hypothetical protein
LLIADAGGIGLPMVTVRVSVSVSVMNLKKKSFRSNKKFKILQSQINQKVQKKQ